MYTRLNLLKIFTEPRQLQQLQQPQQRRQQQHHQRQQQHHRRQQQQRQTDHAMIHVVADHAVIDAPACHVGCQSCGCVHQGMSSLFSLSKPQLVIWIIQFSDADLDQVAVEVHQVAAIVPTEAAVTWAKLKLFTRSKLFYAVLMSKLAVSSNFKNLAQIFQLFLQDTSTFRP